MSLESPAGPGERAARVDRWVFLRDVGVFQLKLLLDGLRDAVLVPVSIAAAVYDLLAGAPSRQRFYQVVVAARRSEAWIDLFEAANRVSPRAPSQDPEPLGLDELARRLESLLVREEARGGLTHAARRSVDRLLDAAESLRSRGRES